MIVIFVLAVVGVFASIIEIPFERLGTLRWIIGVAVVAVFFVIGAVVYSRKKCSPIMEKIPQHSSSRWVDIFLLPQSVLLGIFAGSGVLIFLTWYLQEKLDNLGNAGSYVSGTLGVAASIIGTVVSVYIAGLAYKMAYNVQHYTYLERYQNHRNEAIDVVSVMQNYQRNMSLRFKSLLKNSVALQHELQPILDIAYIQFKLIEPIVVQHFYNEYPQDDIRPFIDKILPSFKYLNDQDIGNAKESCWDYKSDSDAKDFVERYRGFYAKKLDWLNLNEKSQLEKVRELLDPVAKDIKAMVELQVELQTNSFLFPVLSRYADSLYIAEEYLLNLRLDHELVKETSSQGFLASVLMAYAYTMHWLPERLQEYYEGPVDRDVCALVFTSALLQILTGSRTDFIDTLESDALDYQLVDCLFNMMQWLPESSEDLDRIYRAELINPETKEKEKFYEAYSRRNSLLHQEQQLRMLILRLQPDRDEQAQFRELGDPAQAHELFAESRLKVLRKIEGNSVTHKVLEFSMQHPKNLF